MAVDNMPSSENSASSTPPARDKPLFSSSAASAPPSSPPSSPPGFPWEYQQQPNSPAPKSPTRSPKDAFSIMRKGKRKALEPVSGNARPAKRAAPKSARAKSESLTQMQISLGQKVQKTCQQCGMEYNVSSAEDRKLHDKYHKQNTEGYDVGKDFVPKARHGTVFKGVRDDDIICAIDRDDKPARKKKAQAALDIVQRELGAVPIPEKKLWGTQRGESSRPAFRAYMYIRGTKCIGVLLTEGMDGREAYRVVEPLDSVIATNQAKKTLQQTSATEALQQRRKAVATLTNRPVEISSIIQVARLGISRIWTSPERRLQHIATRLLDVAVEHHNRCVEERKVAAEKAMAEAAEGSEKKRKVAGAVKSLDLDEVGKVRGKEDVAFSHPTMMGAGLAARWFGRLLGWSVYVD